MNEIGLDELKILSDTLKENDFYNRLLDFAVESNKIENIHDKESHEEHYSKLIKFLKLKELTLDNVCEFNTWGELRDKQGMDVMVGDSVPPKGGYRIPKDLVIITSWANSNENPFTIHREFENLHPFTDGNGRTGRVIWLWQMLNQHKYDLRYLFLQKYYFQSLQ